MKRRNYKGNKLIEEAKEDEITKCSLIGKSLKGH
jgi:hypothetical protein